MEDDPNFSMPEPREPQGKEPNQVSGNWVELPGSPSCPVEMPLGWCGGGKVKYTLCAANDLTGAPGCYHYNAGADQCSSAGNEGWRADALFCINYKAKL